LAGTPASWSLLTTPVYVTGSTGMNNTAEYLPAFFLENKKILAGYHDLRAPVKNGPAWRPCFFTGPPVNPMHFYIALAFLYMLYIRG
jgi:hypothetical protein